jgi:Fic family protein
MAGHMSFHPGHPYQLSDLPGKFDIDNKEFHGALLKAHSSLAELKGCCRFHMHPLLLLSPTVLREAVASSEVEGIHTTVAAALQYQLFPESRRDDSNRKVWNYRDALIWGFEQLRESPISTRTILGLYRILLPQDRHDYKPQQNAIQEQGSGRVIYAPPTPADTQRLMGSWERFVNEDSPIDPLIRCAIAHYQFEAIHPFSDGNGRIGRILIVLQLVKDGILSLPVLYTSGYISKNRREYYRLLGEVTSSGDWRRFIDFMLIGFATQAEQTTAMLTEIGSLFDALADEIKRDHRAVFSTDLIQALFEFPVINPARLSRSLGVHQQTASAYLTRLARAKILQERREGKYHLFFNHRLLKIIER